jgi:hypothetical protein
MSLSFACICRRFDRDLSRDALEIATLGKRPELAMDGPGDSLSTVECGCVCW